MSEDTLIRYDNLDAIVKARNWGATDLAKATGRKVNQCSDMLRRKKAFGEKIARDFERSLGLPRGWFDEVHDQDDPWLTRPHMTYSSMQMSTGKPYIPYLKAIETDVSAKNWGRAPVVAWARLGEELYKSNEDWEVADTVGFAVTQEPCGTKYKAVEVPDDSLAPRIARGDMVIIDPDNTSPKRNQVALLKGPDGAMMLRRYTPLAGNSFEVTDASGRALDAQRHGLAVVGVAIGLVPHDL